MSMNHTKRSWTNPQNKRMQGTLKPYEPIEVAMTTGVSRGLTAASSRGEHVVNKTKP